MKQSVEHKRIEKLASVSTMADGIAVKEPGTLTFEACLKYVDGIVTVTEAEIASAILMLLEKHKMGCRRRRRSFRSSSYDKQG